MTTLLFFQLDFVGQTGSSEMHMWGDCPIQVKRGICISLECVDLCCPSELHSMDLALPVIYREWNCTFDM